MCELRQARGTSECHVLCEERNYRPNKCPGRPKVRGDKATA
ncbi:MAG: hypothetical protein ACRDYA_14455 [Egibacteraceae bacterium]